MTGTAMVSSRPSGESPDRGEQALGVDDRADRRDVDNRATERSSPS